MKTSHPLVYFTVLLLIPLDIALAISISAQWPGVAYGLMGVCHFMLLFLFSYPKRERKAKPAFEKTVDPMFMHAHT